MGKFVVHLRISCYFYREYFFGGWFVVSALDNLCEGAFSEDFKDFEPICEVTTNFNSIVAFNVVKDRISLELSIIKIFPSLLFLLIEGLDPIVPSIFQALNIFPSSMRYGSSIIYDTELVLADSQLLYLLI